MPTLGSSVTSQLDAWSYQDRIGTADARYTLGALCHSAPGTTISYRGGVFAAGDPGLTDGTHNGLRVSPAGSGLAITIQAGQCIVDTSGNGPYIATNDGVKTLTLAASAATTNRIDLVIARVHDDQNSAIGSASGDRQFTIEVWTGDASSGTPTQPSPTVTAGWIPLAAVYVGKNYSSVSAADVTDLRGPGLTARGGLRVLFGTDAKKTSAAFAEVGNYPGARRWVHSAGFQDQAFWGASAGGWRGVQNKLVYVAYPPGGEESWTKGYTTREICRLTIPDPGAPYHIEAFARMYMNLSPGVGVDVRVTLDSINGAAVNWMRCDSMGDDHDRRKVPNLAPVPYGTLTGQRDVVLSVAIRDIYHGNYNDWGFSYRGFDSGQSVLVVSVMPAYSQPAN
jgi:hypothetical protein